MSRSVWVAAVLLTLAGTVASHAQEAKKDNSAATAKAESAAPASEPAATTTEKESFLVFVYRAEGIFFWPQLILSVVLVGLIVAAASDVRRKNFVPLEYVNQVVDMVTNGKYKEAFDMSSNEKSFIAKVLTAGMENFSRGLPESQAAMDDAAVEHALDYEQRISWLALLANVATMIGLLGTVWGMVAAFMVIAQSDVAPKPSELAAGVSQALITTVWGLLQAIPAVFCFTLFRNKISKFILEAELVSKRVLTRIDLAQRAKRKT